MCVSSATMTTIRGNDLVSGIVSDPKSDIKYKNGYTIAWTRQSLNAVERVDHVSIVCVRVFVGHDFQTISTERIWSDWNFAFLLFFIYVGLFCIEIHHQGFNYINILCSLQMRSTMLILKITARISYAWKLIEIYSKSQILNFYEKFWNSFVCTTNCQI